MLDPRGRLLGRLTVAEVVDVIREEGESDLLSQAGLRDEEDLFSSVWNSAKNRWLWLAVNLCTAFFASRVIGGFEGTIAKVVALAAQSTGCPAYVVHLSSNQGLAAIDRPRRARDIRAKRSRPPRGRRPRPFRRRRRSGPNIRRH